MRGLGSWSWSWRRRGLDFNARRGLVYGERACSWMNCAMKVGERKRERDTMYTQLFYAFTFAFCLLPFDLWVYAFTIRSAVFPFSCCLISFCVWFVRSRGTPAEGSVV
jgi:hypothetical protein